MAERRDEARDAGVLIYGRVLAMAADALMPFIIVRLLRKGDVGDLAGLMLIYETLAVVLTAGLPGSVLYYLADRTPQQRAALGRRLFGVVQALGVLVAGVMLCIGLYGDALLAWLGEQLGAAVSSTGGERTDLSLLVGFSVFPIFDVTQRVFPGFCIAHGRPRAAATFGVLRALGKTTATLVPAGLGLGVGGIIAAMTAYAVLQAAGIALYVARQHRGIERVAPEVSASEMIRFSLPLGMTQIVSTINAAVDRYTILALMSAARFAEYRSGAWQIPVKTFPYAVGQAYMPRFVALLREGRGDDVIALWRQSVHKVSLIVIPVCMVFLIGAEEFVRLAFTDAYLAAAPVFAWYTVYTMGRVTAFGPLIIAAGRSDLIFRAAVFTLASNVVLTVPATLAFGFVGPAIGTAVAFIPTVAVYCRYVAIALDVPFTGTFPLLTWLRVLAVAAVAAGPALAIKLLVAPAPAVGLSLYALTIIPLFVGLARLTGTMSREDLAFAVAWLRLRSPGAGSA